MENNTCKNCDSVNINNFCSDCGQKVYDKRFTVKYFIMSLFSAFNVERGFLYTVKMLFVQPGKVTNDYIKGKTKPYFNPLKYLLIIGGVYAFLFLWLKIFDAGMETMTGLQPGEALQNSSEEAVRLQKQWIDLYMKFVNFIPLLMIPFISIATKWFYRSKRLLYAEHLIINSFIFAQSFLILILLAPLVLIFPPIIGYFPLITLAAIIGYLIYSLNSTYQESPLRSFIGAIFSLFVGYFLFILFFILFILLIVVFIIMTK